MKLSKKLISMLLIVAIIMSIASTGVGAASNPGFAYDDAQSARDAYDALTPEAKAIFEEMLAIDDETREYHIQNVDSTFKVEPFARRSQTAITRAASITQIVSQLNALNLPSSVVYALESVAAGMIAAIADGPLPVGDILLLVATASAAVVIAANWNAISSKWDSIVEVFTDAFSSIAANVIDAFTAIYDEVPNIQDAPNVIRNGNVVTIGRTAYNCNVKLSALNPNQQQGQYFIAVRYNNDIYVDASKAINFALAKGIVTANDSYVGVATSNRTSALMLAVVPRLHTNCNHGVGYYPHYHDEFSGGKCHIWYLT